MTTQVILTGTGVPHAAAGRAGPGVMVRHGRTALQFDAGRATTMRLAELGIRPPELTAVFVTHVHSDHVVALADLAMTRWLEGQGGGARALVVVAPDGPPSRFVSAMLDPYEDDIAVRMHHVGAKRPEVELSSFEATSTPAVVWSDDEGALSVEAVLVHHEPVEPAVAYRIRTPDGAVVISGDTRVCDEVEALAAGCNVLVHEAARTTALRDRIKGTRLETIFSYHADTALLGGLAERAKVEHLVLTHLIPQPTTAEEAAAFERDILESGYRGRVTVGNDLDAVGFP